MTRPRRAAAASGSAAASWLLLGYAAFIVYGSLVPLEFRPLPLAQAWHDFRHIPFLALGIESRADWVANGVLYAPLGFWAVRSAVASRLRRPAASVVALLLGATLAVAVEFAQLFFPPRTVSQNDILAEIIGSGVGAAVACLAGDWLARLASGWSSGGTRLAARLLELYAAAYTALCFFPYDLLLSAAELQAKAQSGAWGWLLVPHATGTAAAALKLLVEVALAAPIGAWLALRRPPTWPPQLLAAALLGALFGAVVEGGQFFIATGISQGASVLTRAAGFAAGAWLAPQLRRAGTAALRRGLRRPALLLTPLYLALVLGASGILSHRWRSASEMASTWSDLRLLPFYYHYYTTEAIALVSLGSVALMFMPAAVLGWARGWPMRATLAAAALLAVLVEAMKLLLAGLHPDPTNVLIAVAATAATLRLLDLLGLLERPAAAAAGDAGVVHGTHAAPGSRGSAADGQPAAATPAAVSGWLLALPVVAIQVSLFPVAPLALALALAACAALAWRWPLLPLAALPALLPVLDLAPWSGRMFWDAYDMLAAVCLCVALHRTRGCRTAPLQPRWLAAAFALLAASLLASSAQALWPLQSWAALGDNAFSSPYSPLNALRIGKGAVLAWLFVRLWRRLEGAGARRSRCFSAGMLAGLAGTVAAVIWERLAFASLADTAADFRVSGLFSTMHTGGAFIECWLAVATAFALAAALRAGRWTSRALGLLLLAGAGYALAVTYSRNGYAALAVVVVVTALVAAMAGLRAGALATQGGRAGTPGWTEPTVRPRQRAGAWRQAAWACVAVAAIAAVAAPVALGPFARARLATIGGDLAVRQAHWQDGLRMRDGGWRTSLVGMGIGRFPDTHYWRSQEPLRAAAYGLRPAEGAQSPRHLRLGTGATLYVEQIITLPQDPGALQMTASVRAASGSSAAAAVLAVALCEKWLLTSQRCVAASATVPAAVAGRGIWQHVDLRLDAAALLDRAAWWRPPLTFALLTPKDAAVDVADLRLTAADGSELLRNGDFAHGMDRWFFTTDTDPPWQLHSLPLQVLFDQGWLGVAAWSAVLLGALGVGARLALRAQALVPAALPALCGFLVSGTLNTLIDAPRFLWLLLVLAWLAAQPCARQGARTAAGARAAAD